MVIREDFREHGEYSRSMLTSSYLKDGVKSKDEDLLVNILDRLLQERLAKVKINKKEITKMPLPAEIDWSEVVWEITFVGVAVISGCVLVCYPKYISKTNPTKEIPQIMEVIQKYKLKEKQRKTIDHSLETVDDGNEPFNILSLMRWLLLDYYENGIYSNVRNIVEVNGTGKILWEKTINNTVAIVNRGKPYYVELLTEKRINDDDDYCKRLHEWILTKITKDLRKIGLLDLLELTPGAELTNAKKEDFGGEEYICYRLEKELSTQFSTRKQLLLKNMYDYISEEDTLYDKNGFTFLGVRHFEQVWQDVCSEIMDNKLANQLGTLLQECQKELKDDYVKEVLKQQEELCNLKLIELIEKPRLLNGRNNKREIYIEELDGNDGEPGNNELKRTLIPDLITIKKIAGKWWFIIFDAKYYDAVELIEGEKPNHFPGIEDIGKQYLYQLAYQPFIRHHDFKIANCFLMPWEGNKVEYGGMVSFGMLRQLVLQMLGHDFPNKIKKIQWKLEKLEIQEILELQKIPELEDIKVYFLPAKKVYDAYLNKKLFDDFESLKLDGEG